MVISEKSVPLYNVLNCTVPILIAQLYSNLTIDSSYWFKLVVHVTHNLSRHY